MVEGYKGSFAPDGDRASKVVHCAWEDRAAMIVGFRGFPFTWNNLEAVVDPTRTARVFKLSRALPQPYSHDFPYLFCTGVDFLGGYGNHRPATLPIGEAQARVSQGVDLPALDCGEVVFDYAQLQLNYATLPYEVESDSVAWDGAAGELARFVTRKTSFAATNLPVPSGSFRWVTPPKHAIQEGGVPKTFPSREIVYTWKEIPGDVMWLVRSRIDQMEGKVNATAFDRTPEGGGARGFPAQTVLFLGGEEIPGRRLWNGNLLYDVVFRMLVQNNGVADATDPGLPVYAGWNHLYRGPGASPQFQLATADGTAGGQRIYQTAELNDLFSIDPVGLGFGI